MTKNLAGTNIPAGNGGVTFPSPNEWPVTVIPITAIQKGLTTLVTAPNHGITLSSSQSTPKVDFSQVKGMSQINGQFGFVLSVPNSSQVVVGVNSLQFNNYIAPADRTWNSINITWHSAEFPWNYFTYVGGGFLNVTGGSPPDDPLTNLYP